MPGDVVSGQKIGGNLSAGDWNRMRAHLARTEPPKGFGVPSSSDESAGDGIALVKNSASETFAPGEVVGLESPEFTASDDENTIRNNLHFKGAVPTSDHTGKFGVVLNGLAAEGTTAAQIHGLCWAKLNMTAEGDAFADIEADTKILKSGGSGAAQILYHFPKGTEYPQETVGYVRLGNKNSAALNFAGFYDNNTVTMSATSSISNRSIMKWDGSFGNLFDDDSLDVYYDAADDYVKVTTDGVYAIWLRCGVSHPSSPTADPQRIIVSPQKQTGSGGTPADYFLVGPLMTVFSSDPTTTAGDMVSGFTIASLVEGDWLTTSAYNATVTGTKVSVEVGPPQMMIVKIQ